MHNQFSYVASGSVGVSEHANPTALRFEYDGGGVIRHQIGSDCRVVFHPFLTTKAKTQFSELRFRIVRRKYTSQPRAPPGRRAA